MTISDERIERAAKAVGRIAEGFRLSDAVTRAVLEADAPEIAAAKAEGLLACVEALHWADSIMHAIVENDPDELIADGGISVWHGIERDARRWITNHGNEWKALSDARTARLASLQPEVAKQEEGR